MRLPSSRGQLNGLSMATFEKDVLPILTKTCAACCHQAIGSSMSATPIGTSFRNNRFVLTGDAEGDYGVTVSMISNTCNPASNYLLKKPSTVPHPTTRATPQTTADPADRQRQLQHHCQLDRHRLLTLMTVLRRTALSIALLGTLAACGGSSNPLGNPPVVMNPDIAQGNQHLSFAYFQKCINPIFLAQLPIQGASTSNTCAGAGCHDTVTGTGGAFRVVTAAQPLDLSRSGQHRPTSIRATDIYKNFYSAQGLVRRRRRQRRAAWSSSRCVLDVLHGGGPSSRARTIPTSS